MFIKAKTALRKATWSLKKGLRTTRQALSKHQTRADPADLADLSDGWSEITLVFFEDGEASIMETPLAASPVHPPLADPPVCPPAYQPACPPSPPCPSPAALPVNILPVEILPVSTLLVETLLAETLLAGTRLVEALPVNTLPVDTLPVNTLPVDTLPVETVPVETMPVETLPVKTLPVNTLPMDTLPMETLPVDTFSIADDIPLAPAFDFYRKTADRLDRVHDRMRALSARLDALDRQDMEARKRLGPQFELLGLRRAPLVPGPSSAQMPAPAAQ